ncbi:MAG TPA: hypothetical protein VHW71_04285 [Steroidobacteraceae bacterium]|jgi:hypothetical protein|nr:hypothetical protein [Steroidobacteraceae bacterium]
MPKLALPFIALAVSVSPLATSAAQAMEIRQFDKMAGLDQDEYTAELIQGAEKVLTDEGKPDLSARVSKLFTTRLGNDQISVGMTEFSINLARARLVDVQNVAKDSNAQRIEVEDAMGVTLNKNGIEVPDSFFTVLVSFRPKLPLKK